MLQFNIPDVRLFGAVGLYYIYTSETNQIIVIVVRLGSISSKDFRELHAIFK